MKRLKKIFNSLHGKNKAGLTQIFMTTDTDDKKFFSNDLSFYFSCPNFRILNQVSVYITIPIQSFNLTQSIYPVVLEDYFLRLLSSDIILLNNDDRHQNKSAREKGQIEIQPFNEIITKRNGAFYTNEVLNIKLKCVLPLINGTYVNGKLSFAMIKNVMKIVNSNILLFDNQEYLKRVDIYRNQQNIREFLKAHDYVCFIANGSILPRENGSIYPMKEAIPFISPKSLEVTIDLGKGNNITGMGIKKGITVITGGGYAGKSTLLDAIEMGVYDHIPNDGREYCITDNTALKICAEDGRPVHSVNLSPFFTFLPKKDSVNQFTTNHASGSVSEAVNIIEAIYAGCKLMLIDEDKSATNFMVRDNNMRKIVKNEPIIPLTDRIRELYEKKGVSTLLVIGGSSEYLNYTDTLILMDNYIPLDITKELNTLELVKHEPIKASNAWMIKRYLNPIETNQEFIFFQTVTTENAKKIVLDEFSSDISFLTAIISENQINTMAYMMEKLMTDQNANRDDLMNIILQYTGKYNENRQNNIDIMSLDAERWFDYIRPIDTFCCISRMRGIDLKSY